MLPELQGVVAAPAVGLAVEGVDVVAAQDLDILGPLGLGGFGDHLLDDGKGLFVAQLLLHLVHKGLEHQGLNFTAKQNGNVINGFHRRSSCF